MFCNYLRKFFSSSLYISKCTYGQVRRQVVPSEIPLLRCKYGVIAYGTVLYKKNIVRSERHPSISRKKNYILYLIMI